MEPLSTRPTEKELAFHTAWMRRLARALVDDASTADDVVQDAWAKLAPRRAPLGAGYLAAVVRSVAWSRHRGETRRSRREAASARPEALPSAAEVSARVEIARRVAEALQELPEPYRTTLVLRYYDDLSAADIARREGIPAATVRSRLARGLGELRARLDARPGGREAWLAALVPFTRTEVGASGALAASLTGLIAMKIAFAGLSAVLCLVLAWRFVAEGRDSTDNVAVIAHAAPSESGDGHARSTTGSDEDEATARSAATVRVPAPEPSESAPGRAETFEILARALDDRDRPLSGAWLEVDLQSGRFSTADRDGRIAHALEPAAVERMRNGRSNRLSHVQIGAPGRRTLHVRPSFAPNADSLDLGDVRLDPGATLLGRVVDEHGFGVEGAVVVWDAPREEAPGNLNLAFGPPGLTLRPWDRGNPAVTAMSERGGAFRIEGLSAGFGSLWARTDRGVWTCSAPIGLRAGEEQSGVEILVKDAPERVISGTVVDPRGSPLPGLEVVFSQSRSLSGWTAGFTDARGRFHGGSILEVIASIHIPSPSWEWEDLVVYDVPVGSLDLELAFVESAWLAVEVRGSRGESLRDGKVTGIPANGPTEVPLPRCDATLDAEGRGRLRRPDVPLRVRVEAPSYRSVLLGPFEPGAFPDPLVATLEPLPALLGQVLRPDGTPATGARISLHRGTGVDSRTGEAYQLTHQGWGGDGEAFVHLLHVDPIAAVTADDEGRYRLPLPGVDPAATGEVARPSEGLAGLGYVSDDAQRLAKAKPVDLWYVHAALAGEATLTSGPHTLGTSEDSELELRLPRGGSIAGRLRIDGDRSPAGWTMVATDALAEFAEVPVGRDGSYRFEHLHVGGWQLSAYEPGKRHYPEARMRTERLPEPDVQVEEGRTTKHDHLAQPRESARLSGRLLIDGNPPRAWRVHVSTSTPQSAIIGRESTLDPDGNFHLRLQPGLATSLQFYGAHAGTQMRIEASPSIQTGDQDWSFDVTSARIEGRVASSGAKGDGLTKPYYEVELDGVRVSATVVVDGEGRFGPVVVAAGHGVLRGPQRDMREPRPIWAELDLAPGETRTLDLR